MEPRKFLGHLEWEAFAFPSLINEQALDKAFRQGCICPAKSKAVCDSRKEGAQVLWPQHIGQARDPLNSE